MSKFCGGCGKPVSDSAAFCGSCGASTQNAASSSPMPEFQPVAQPVVSSAPPCASPASTVAKGSSPWVKVVVVAVVIIFVGGALAVGGVIYVAHKVSQKAHQYRNEFLGESTPSSPGAENSPAALTKVADKSDAPAGEACHLLSKEDVSLALGIAITETRPAEGGCAYFAKGTAADMAAKHTAAMVGARGADKKTQGMIEQFAGVIGSNLPKTETSDTETADGNVVVLTFGIDTNSAQEQMRLNSKVLGMGGMGSIDAIDGIGDEAFSKADSMMFVRKGDKLIRIMYMSCPCSTEAIKPLAKKLVANL